MISIRRFIFFSITIVLFQMFFPQIKIQGQSLSDEAIQKLIKQGKITSSLNENGDAAVIIELSVQTKAEAALNRAARRSQRERIKEVQNKIRKLLEGKNFSNLKLFETIPFISLSADTETIEALAKSKEIKAIIPDELSKPILDTSISQIGANTAFQSGYTGSGQTVVILDTGSDTSHEFITNKIVAGACFSSNYPSINATSLCPNGDPESTTIASGDDCDLSNDGCGHGTHVAGIAAGDNSTISGVAIDANLIPIQVFTKFDNTDYCGASNPCVLSYASDQAEALEHIYLNLAKQNDSGNPFTISSVNMSLGGGLYSSECDTFEDSEGNTVQDIRLVPMQNLESIGIATIVSSGNDGSSTGIGKPACLSPAISVAAVNDSDDIANFSNTNSLLDLLAPGVSIASSYPTSSTGYANLSGTSMAAPHVAGAWALMKQKDPNASVSDVLQDFKDTGIEITDPDNSLAFDRIQVDQALSENFSASIAEGTGEGWRFLSSPAIISYKSLLDPLWTQGPDYSDAPSVPLSESNVLVYDGSASIYESVSDLNTNITAGSGLAVNVYPDNNFDGTNDGWPKSLSITGMENIGDIQVDNLLYSGTEVFTLLGNPYNSTIDFDLFTNQNDLGNVVYVYDHDCSSLTGPDEDGGDAGGCFKAWNGSSGGLTNGLITAFQGFFVYAMGSSPTLTIPESSKSTGGTFHKNDQIPSLQLKVTLNKNLSADTWFSFTKSGSLEKNENDAPYLYPIDYKPFVSIRSETDQTGYLIKNLPRSFDEPLEIPLTIEGWQPDGNQSSPGYIPLSGDVELRWPTVEHIPENWTLTLTDHRRGSVIDMKKTGSYHFTLHEPKAKIKSMPYSMKIKAAKSRNFADTRFSLTIYPEPVMAVNNQEKPTDFTLHQNYPNPFNPSTVIRYNLPELSNVDLEVFSIDGQKVATIASGLKEPGSHTVTFNGNTLSSGIYIYRLTTGQHTLTRKMILIK